MTPERWHKIEEIFHEALELENAERPAFLDKKAAGDAELRAEVEKLLAQFDDASSFIEQPLYDRNRSAVLSGLLVDGDEDPMIGKVLGSYRIEREIGRGGMGAVYEAVRADGEFRLRVALKVVKRGVDTDFVLRRFRNERQILAALDHPFITRLIDGGTTDDGRPYFVMEYIDGLQLYRYCDRQRLSINERLKLFARVCEAVEYAHQKRVIHRDLKPSNIFITNDGSPRLLDFGIAKLLDPELAVDTLHPTATALRMMTVDYASPEQIRGEIVTYASDVYSLGVILFELLTGFRPYAGSGRAAHAVARAICDDEPPLASEAVSGKDLGLAPVPVNSTATTLIDIAELRRDSPSELRSELRGNLDNIISKALQKQAQQRYGSVTEFRSDIERHFKGETVSAPLFFLESIRPSVDAADDSTLVAVLPLTLMNPGGAENTDEAYLTIGLADAIITRLTSVRKLTVRPTSSITRYNEHFVNPFRAGKELGVDYVLDGRIRRFGERLRISLQLLEVSKGSAIWAGQFDKHLTDVLELEDAISEEVAAALIPQLTGEDLAKLAKRGTDDPRAYEAYLRGRFYWNQFTSQSLPKAIEAFHTAIQYDPNYALAHVGIADFYIWANIYGLVPVAESYEYAEASARRALQIDKELGEAYASMGLIVLNKFEYAKAERLFKRSIELSPHYSLSHEWYSALLIGTGRITEGLEEARRAGELDPLSLRTKILVIWSHYQAGEYGYALEKAEEVIGQDESYPQGHLQRGYVLCEMGRTEEAVVEMELANEQMPGSALVEFGLSFAYAAAGRKADARKLADAMAKRSQREYVKPMFLFFANVAAERFEEALRYLEIGVEERDPWLAWLGTEVKLRGIRNDPRFTELLHRTNKTLDGGKLQILDSALEDFTSTWRSESDTSPEVDLNTASVAPGFFDRHKWKFAAAGIFIVSLFAAYTSGYLSVNLNSGTPVVERKAPVPVQSVAILPFENATGDLANDYIAEGMSDALIARMSNFPDIRVVPRTSAYSYKQKQSEPRVVGSELGVEGVLTGRLRKHEDGFMVHVEMVGVTDGRTILAMSFSEKADRIFALQDTMSARVIEALKLTAAGPTPNSKTVTLNNDAFQFYLKGEYNRQKGTPAAAIESIEFYKRAIGLDPEYALAYQGLSLAYRAAPAYGAMTPQEAYPKVKDAAHRALELDPSLSTAYVALAAVKATYDWDFSGAEQEYKQAIQLSPNSPEAHYGYGNFLVAMGRTDEALAEFRNALQSDPLSLNILTNIGWAHYIAGRYNEAEKQVRMVIERDPTFPRAYLTLGEILEEQGRYDEAINSIQNMRQLSQDPLADMALGHVYALAGRRAEALKMAAELEEKVRDKKVSPFLPAVIYAGLNEKDKAFYWFERAYQERSNWFLLIKVGRRLKNLHGDPRFDDLLKRVGFSG
jgi:eukaryotic-like serine/threonine-protein kinase